MIFFEIFKVFFRILSYVFIKIFRNGWNYESRKSSFFAWKFLNTFFFKNWIKTEYYWYYSIQPKFPVHEYWMSRSLGKYQKRKNDVGYRPNSQNNTFYHQYIFFEIIYGLSKSNFWNFNFVGKKTLKWTIFGIFYWSEPHSIVIIAINKVIFMS